MRAHFSILAMLLVFVAIPCTVEAGDAHRKKSPRSSETAHRLGITMVDIPAGNFLMGSCKITSSMQEENKKRVFMGQAPLSSDCNGNDSDANDWETPQHQVSVRAFQMGETEVTLGQFKQFVAAKRRTNLIDEYFMEYNAYGDNAPVVNVSWHDAQAFIAWLNEQDGGGYRLPSESEWEYACRAGGSDTYCGGSSADSAGWYNGNSDKHQHAVREKQPNSFGLYDMSGNVAEWVQDCWHIFYSNAPNDGSAWNTSCRGNDRVLRGGSWSSKSSYVRASSREMLMPTGQAIIYGFRIARTLP